MRFVYDSLDTSQRPLAATNYTLKTAKKHNKCHLWPAVSLTM